MRPIEPGDKVVVSMSRNDCFPFQSAPSFEARILHTPAISGLTLWYLQVGESVVILNPCSSDFIGIIKVDKG